MLLTRRHLLLTARYFCCCLLLPRLRHAFTLMLITPLYARDDSAPLMLMKRFRLHENIHNKT